VAPEEGRGEELGCVPSAVLTAAEVVAVGVVNGGDVTAVVLIVAIAAVVLAAMLAAVVAVVITMRFPVPVVLVGGSDVGSASVGMMKLERIGVGIAVDSADSTADVPPLSRLPSTV
jgi:hypothetical protein